MESRSSPWRRSSRRRRGCRSAGASASAGGSSPTTLRSRELGMLLGLAADVAILRNLKDHDHEGRAAADRPRSSRPSSRTARRAARFERHHSCLLPGTRPQEVACAWLREAW
jgi:hypothetical protein